MSNELTSADETDIRLCIKNKKQIFPQKKIDILRNSMGLIQSMENNMETLNKPVASTIQKEAVCSIFLYFQLLLF